MRSLTGTRVVIPRCLARMLDSRNVSFIERGSFVILRRMVSIVVAFEILSTILGRDAM